MSEQYNCEVCTAQCTIEAMMMCQCSPRECPVLKRLADGTITDRRPTDMDPNFPSEFTWTSPGGAS